MKPFHKMTKLPAMCRKAIVKKVTKIYTEYQQLTIQMDGKKYDGGGNFVERQPYIVSGFENGDNELLEIPTLPDGKAKKNAKKK